jgi:amino acid adenylation domain-containing protein
LVPFLSDHRVGPSVVVPAAALVEMAFAAVRDALGNEFHTLRNVTFERLLSLDEQRAVDVRVAVSGASDGAEFLIEEVLGPDLTSAVARGRAVVAHAVELAPGDATSDPCAAAGEPVSRDELYAILEQHGLSYGPLCRGVERLRCTPELAVGSIRIPADFRDDVGRYHIHPVVLDSALHVAALLAERSNGGEMWIPRALEEITWRRSPGVAAQSIVRRRASTAGDLRFDVELRDEREQLCARLTGLVICRAGTTGEPQLQDGSARAVRRQLLSTEAVPAHAAVDMSFAGVRAWLLRAAAEVLELDPQDLASAGSLLQLGTDSLSALELRNRLYRGLGVELSVAEFLRGRTIDDLAQVIASRVSPQASGAAPLPTPDFRPESSPLSKGQAALYLLHELTTDNSSYNVGEALRLVGELDVEALRVSIARLARRHPMLRVVFFLEGDDVRQRVEDRDPDVPVIDASMWSHEELHRRLLDDVTRRFDLQQAPPFRATLYRCGRAEHVLTFVIHHIAEDFWSLVILLRELIAMYEEATTRTPAELPSAPAQYGHFIAWQAHMLSGAEGERHRAYWRRQLASPLPLMNLPGARTRPLEKTFAGRTFGFTLDLDIGSRLRALADEKNVTQYSVALAAFAVLLHRYTGQTDLVIGSPFAGRPHPDLDQVVGYFDNPLPLRIDLLGNPRFDDLLRRIHQVVLEAQEHQYLPFPVIVEQARPARDASRSPLFDYVFVLRKAQSTQMQELTAFTVGDTTEVLRMGSVRIENAGVLKTHSQAQFDLTLALCDIRGILKGSIEYNTDLFDEATMQRLAGHYQTVLRSIVQAPSASIDHLSIVTAEERAEAVERWNDTAWGGSPRIRLHQLFEDRVDEDPTRLAIVSSGRSVSYGEVERRANSIASRLLDAGVHAGDIVAVILPKGWQEVVAVIGVLKAGAAYLPIDPAWPSARRLDLLKRSSARVAVTAAERLALELPPDVLGIDIGLGELERGAARPAMAVDPHNTAYVIFTSGSTGSPKGVVTDHLGPVNTIVDVNDRFGVGPRDRVLAISRLTFDLSVYDIFGMLGAGGAIAIPADNERHDPAAWADLVLRHEVTIWNSVPAVFQLYLQHLAEHPADRPRSLRLVLLSGDWIPMSQPEQASRLLPGARLVSLGGATEASIWSILHPIDAVDRNWTSIPYGRPMRNQQIYVLDRNQEPCPRGVAGEIHIGGRGVARGYLGAAEQTAQAFFDCPAPMGRVYRTGDLGRYREDGVVEFLGRNDRQVKIRGHRVELEEVEAILLRQPDVAEAAVVPFHRASGQQGLAAYIVPGRQQPELERLRARLSAVLPDYMMPASILCVDKFPLTPNGKVDRSALPQPDAASEPSGPLDDITDPVGAAMVRLWTRHLRKSRVRIDDDFYALGGDSITAIQIAADARREGLRVSPGEILRAGNIGGLLRAMADAASGESSTKDSAANWERRAAARPRTRFPLSGLSQQELERVLAKFERG